MKKAIITGITGQDGAYLSQLLLNKGYKVLLVTDIRGNDFLRKNIDFKSCILNADTPTNKKLFKKILSLVTIFFSILRSAWILKRKNQV